MPWARPRRCCPRCRRRSRRAEAEEQEARNAAVWTSENEERNSGRAAPALKQAAPRAAHPTACAIASGRAHAVGAAQALLPTLSTQKQKSRSRGARSEKRGGMDVGERGAEQRKSRAGVEAGRASGRAPHGVRDRFRPRAGRGRGPGAVAHVVDAEAEEQKQRSKKRETRRYGRRRTRSGTAEEPRRR